MSIDYERSVHSTQSLGPVDKHRSLSQGLTGTKKHGLEHVVHSLFLVFKSLVLQHQPLFVFSKHQMDLLSFLDAVAVRDQNALAMAISRIVETNKRLAGCLEKAEAHQSSCRKSFIRLLELETAADIAERAMSETQLGLEAATRVMFEWVSSLSCYDPSKPIKVGQILHHMKQGGAEITDLVCGVLPSFDGCISSRLRLLGKLIAELVRIDCFDLAKYFQRLIVNGSLNQIDDQAWVSLLLPL